MPAWFKTTLMAGKNRGICHSCRHVGHMLSECPKKIRCPNCVAGYIKWMEVEKNNEHKGLPFHCCTRDCKYFKWCKNEPNDKCPLHDHGETSGITNGGEPVDDLSRMLKTLVNLTDEKDLEISLNIKMCTGKRVLDDFI